MPYTQLGEPRAEARIQADLDRIVAAVRDTAAGGDALSAVFLLGGYARGDGTAVEASPGSWRGFNDYDLLLGFESSPREPDRYARLAASLARMLEIDFVDLGVASREQLETGQPTLFWYEFYQSHRLLWQAADAAPFRFPPLKLEALDPLEGVRLAHNRGMALLWAALRLWPEGPPGESPVTRDPEALRFSRIACHKAVLAAAEVRLLPEKWALSQEERAQRVFDEPPSWADPRFLARYRNAVAFRRSPGHGTGEDVGALWFQARKDLEQGMREIHSPWLGTSDASWGAGRRRLQRQLYWNRLKSPRSLKRWLSGRNPSWHSEPGWFAELPRLLFRGPEEPWARGWKPWRESARMLIQAWHP